MSTRRYIRYFSKHIYRYLSRVFSFKLAIDERGINDHLVFSIVEYCHKQGFADVLIYKSRKPKEETDYGHDFDLFVECENAKFAYFALQAKVMNFNGKYPSFDYAKKQWEKLEKHEKKFYSKAYYMFYNGKYLKTSTLQPPKTDCLGIPLIEEYGIGIVENEEIAKKVAGGAKSICFTDFYPEKMNAFRKLFYCSCNDLGGIPLLSFDEIDISFPYDQVKLNSEFSIEESIQNEDLSTPDGGAPIRIIVKRNDTTFVKCIL